MENRAYALAAGLFTLLLGFGVVVAALWFSGDAVETRDYLMVSRVPVSGLNTQAPVRYRGVTVGKVTDIKTIITNDSIEALTVDGDLASDLLARGTAPEDVRELGMMARALRECVGGCTKTLDGQLSSVGSTR